MSDTIELVQFKLKASVTEADFIAANEAIGVWVQQQDGFKYRSLSLDDEGTWSDTVYWASLPAAKMAGDKFMQEQGDSAFMAMIDSTSLRMNHSQVVGCWMSGSCAD